MRCDDEEPPEFLTMSFIVPMSAQEAKSEFQKGDTLWFSATFPDTLLEYYSNKYYKLSAFDFRTSVAVFSISFPELYIGQQPGAINSFPPVNGHLQRYYGLVQ
jgi:hypothetical protein